MCGTNHFIIPFLSLLLGFVEDPKKLLYLKIIHRIIILEYPEQNRYTYDITKISVHNSAIVIS